uniref:Uncharacterized protein n=1 Tax=Rhizophora mucronata TaxID=61149 RepID=A0A2P2IW79_RHIMU
MIKRSRDLCLPFQMPSVFPSQIFGHFLHLACRGRSLVDLTLLVMLMVCALSGTLSGVGLEPMLIGFDRFELFVLGQCVF